MCTASPNNNFKGEMMINQANPFDSKFLTPFCTPEWRRMQTRTTLNGLANQLDQECHGMQKDCGYLRLLHDRCTTAFRGQSPHLFELDKWWVSAAFARRWRHIFAVADTPEAFPSVILCQSLWSLSLLPRGPTALKNVGSNRRSISGSDRASCTA